MTDTQAGLSAMVVAYARAYHATHDSPKIFDDFLADSLFTPEEHTQLDQMWASLLPYIDPELAATHPDPDIALAWVVQLINGPITLGRSRYTEDCLEDAIRAGVRQYVILGAGFDTFAFRRPDLADRLQVFELDHPVTQAHKRDRIAAAGWTQPENLHFIPVDFTRENLVGVLRRSPYDADQLSFFSWLGVSFYLTRAVVINTLRSIASIARPGSQIVFDYLDMEAFQPEKTSKRVQLMQWMAVQIGEPMKAGFDPLGLGAELGKLELRLEENLTPADVESRYYQGRADRYHAIDHFHFARAMVTG